MKEYSVWIDEAEKIVSFHEVDNSELMFGYLRNLKKYSALLIWMRMLLSSDPRICVYLM